MVAVSSKNNKVASDNSSELAAGQLVIIGGAEDKEGECSILREFVRRAGGRNARIVVMTVATGLPEEVGTEYRRIFEGLGTDIVDIIDTATKEDARESRYLDLIEEATGVFFTGGDQARITELLRDTETHSLLQRRYQEGLIIGGTSAGAAMMPETTIIEGDSETNPTIDSVVLSEGMGFFPDVAIDQHFSQRGRIGRFVSAIMQSSTSLGFGIDENTAIIVNGDRIEVIGEGAVTIVDTANISHSNIDEALHDDALAICGAKLHILPHGYSFSLKDRDCLC